MRAIVNIFLAFASRNTGCNLRRLGSQFYHRAACGSLPAIHKLVGSGNAADYEWQAVSDDLLSIGHLSGYSVISH
jgi:hypothetical protein